ncbi:class I ribonucleotide reductase maintenance protein YfaE [Porticoccus sp. GXU_MW_L64]
MPTHKADTNEKNDFQLDSTSAAQPIFELEPDPVDLLSYDSAAFEQQEFFIPLGNAEQPEETPQIELDGMAKPAYGVAVVNINGDETARAVVQFQHANNLLESLEAQDVYVPYQCREGYCGSCRTQLVSGEVAYLQAPMAWVNDDEILPCCCVPKTDLQLKLKG